MPDRVVVIGVDPGARETGVAVLDVTDTPGLGVAPLLDQCTIRRLDRDRPDQVPADYLDSVASILGLMIESHLPPTGGVVGVEGVRSPRGFANGRRHTIDPAGIIGASITYGAILAALGDRHVVRRIVRPAGNGHLLPLTAYPTPLATNGKGTDKLRHVRSAYDVALMARHSPPALIGGFDIEVTNRAHRAMPTERGQNA